MNVIEAINIEMRYKGQAEPALKPVSFSVGSGEVLGLIGQNGSGKSTLLKILATILVQTSGELFVLGRNSRENGHYIRENTGVFFEPERALYWRLTGFENLQRIAGLRRIPEESFLKQSEKILRKLDLYDDRNKFLYTYSKGMKVKLHIAAAFLGEPKIILLDEPTAGLDYRTRYQVLSLVKEYVQKGNTVVICSHDLSDIRHLCHRVFLLRKGEKIAYGSPDELIRSMPGEGIIQIKSPRHEEIAKWAGDYLHPLKIHCEDDCVSILTEHLLEDMQAVRSNMPFEYSSITYREKELSDMFLYSS